MDMVTYSFYEMKLRLDYATLKATAFQKWVENIMELRYPDFIRVRPWGRAGDRKNDGYIPSQRTLLQVYAPNEMTASTAIAKIKEDFSGALPYWREYFSTWAFVHNAADGLAPDIVKELLELGQQHSGSIAVEQWGLQRLRILVFELSQVDIAAILGPAPSNQALLDLGYKDLDAVLSTIAQEEVPSGDVRPVSPEKLAYNKLSPNIAELLRSGMSKASLVEKYFDSHPDPMKADKICSTFNSKYIILRDNDLQPDMIFNELWAFAGGQVRKSPAIEAAVLSVLAYLFERCDIFEDVPEGEGVDDPSYQAPKN